MRALDRGATPEEVIRADNESRGDYADRLEQIITGKANGTDNRAAGRDRSGGNQGSQGGQTQRGRARTGGAEAESADATRAAGVDEEVARPPRAEQAGLFREPTSRERTDAAAREKDAQRNGRRGGREDDGDGGLFDGERPEQIRIDESTESAEAARQLSRDVGNEDADRLGLRDAVSKALGPVADRVEYLHGYEGLPENMRRGVESRNALGRKGVTAAMYSPDTGRVFIFTQVTKTPARAVWHAAHEIAGHEGLRALLGDRINPALNIARQNPTVKALADEIYSQRKIADQMAKSGKTHADGVLLATEEALAELAAAVRTGDYAHIGERYGVDVPQGVQASVKAAIANFLKRLKAMIDDLFGKHVFTDEDVRSLLEAAFDAAQRKASGQPTASVERPDGSSSLERIDGAAIGEPQSALDSTEGRADTKDLIAQHNLSAEKLLHADRMGGLAVPSLAVTRVGHPSEGFGDITLLGDKGIVDPKRGAKAFGADVYSPRYPEVLYKLDKNAVRKVNDALGTAGKYWDTYVNVRDMSSEPAFKNYAENVLGPDWKYSDSQALAANLLRESGATEHTFEGFTNAGYRRYKPHTLASVVAKLKKDLRGGENWNYGVGSLRAKLTPQFRSIEAIRKAKGRLSSKDDFSGVKDAVDAELFKIVDALAPYAPGSDRLGFADTVVDMLGDSVKMGLPRAFREYGMEDVGTETQQEIAAFLNTLRELPTEYFEVKQLRAVGLDEFRAAVIPKDASQSVRDVLAKHGIEASAYDPDVKGDRARVVREVSEVSDLLFNTEPTDEQPAPRRATRRTPADAQRDAAVRRSEAQRTLGGPTAGGAIGWNFDTRKWEGDQGTLRRARASLDDKMLAWRDVQGNIAEALGKTIPDAQNVYRLENLMHGRVKEGIDTLEADRIVPLVQAMDRSGVTPAQLDEYLYARHAKERNAQIASINPGMPEGGSGMTNAEADAILAKADKAKLDPLARRVDALTRQTRQRLLDSGLITKEQFDAMEAQYQHYVPLRGKQVRENEFDGSSHGAGRGLDTRPSPVKNALGRGAGNRAENILGEIIGDAQRSIIASEKARVGRAVMRLVLANPNPALWSVEPVQTERKLDANGEVYEAVVHDWSDPSIIAVRHRGNVYKVQINFAPLAQALNMVGVDQLSGLTRAAGALNRYFSSVLTRYNPAFIPVNATRDALFGLTGLSVEHGELAAMQAALYYPKAIRAAWKEARRAAPTTEADRYAREFAQDGGKTGYVNMPSVEDLARKIGNGRLGSYNPHGIAKAGRALADMVGVMNDSVENALRLSAYVTLRKRGMSREAAAAYAKEMTVNFNRKGYAGSKLNAWLLFYNASMQGAKRTATLAKHPKTWAYLGALAAVQVAAVMYGMGQEDDDGTPIWDKVPDYVKQRNLVFTWLDDSGEQHLLTIPMPYGFNIMPYLAGRVTDAMMHREDRPQDSGASIAADVLSASVQSFSPVPLDDGALGLVPTALRIPLSIQVNRNDWGRQISKENPFGKFDVPRSTVGRPDTLELFKVASKGLNRIGGGDDYTPPPLSAFDLAPEDIEYILDKLGGGAGKFVVDVATLGQMAAGDAPVTSRDIPIINRFTKTVDDKAAQQSLFYDRRETIERSLDKLRDTFERDGERAALTMIKASPELKGAGFKRYKTTRDGHVAGQVIVSDGRPQIVAVNDSAVFGRYKATSKVVNGQNEAIREAYTAAPMTLLPNGQRDVSIRAHAQTRAEAQKAFNAAWNRDVVAGGE
jgi:hypothetical protein